MTTSATMKDGNLPIKAAEKTTLKHKRRYCKVEGCSRIVKSQGVCQRHGAKPRKCRVVDCPKQAQGNYDGMCKAHFRAHKNNEVLITDDQPKAQRTAHALLCQPVVVPHDTLVTDESLNRQGPEGEESTVTSNSHSTEEDVQGRDLWDEPFFYSTGTRNEELAADLFGVLSDMTPSMTCEDWSGGQITREEELLSVGNRVLSVSSIPSCSDYSPSYYTSNTYERRDATNSNKSSSSYMDYYIHENASAREAV